LLFTLIFSKQNHSETSESAKHTPFYMKNQIVKFDKDHKLELDL